MSANTCQDHSFWLVLIVTTKVAWKKITKFVKSRIGILLILILVVPLTVLAGSRVVNLFSSASVIPANIVVDAQKSQADLQRPWEGLSQGGEQEVPGQLVSLAPAATQVKALGTRFVRIDHVLEEPFNNTVRARILEIQNSGATPFIALSYFPSDVATSQIGTPTNYPRWQKKVKDLVELVSGKNNMNITGVYYEVWNEPDGENFGGFNVGRGKDYFELYKQSVAGARAAENVNDFKIGGPALADLRRCDNGLIFVCQTYWLDQFLNLVSANNTRLDFISWHRYSTKLDDYREDVNFINDLYNKYSTLPQAEKIITEWGSVPERSPIHNTVFDAAHLVAATRTFIGHVDMTTKFEIRDGPDSEDKGWGILYHNGAPKPTYAALLLLSKLRAEKLLISGEGSNVIGIASRDSSGVSVILANFDRSSTHTELVPVKISNMTPGAYRVTKTVINSKYPLGKVEVALSTFAKGNFVTSETMLPNSVVFYDFQLIRLLTTNGVVN